MDPSVVVMILVLLFAVIFHEVCHGWVADKLGDPTARNLGRLTLNPVPHIDPLMTIVMPAICYITMGFVFGGAKPVPVNPYNFRNPKRDMAITAAAGPASNFLLIIISIVLYKILVAVGVFEPMIGYGRINNGDLSIFEYFFFYSIIVNSVLMTFNLIPIPPLDGSKILMGFLNYEQARKFESVSRYGIMIIIGIIFLGDLFNFSIIGSVVWPVATFFLDLTFIV